MKHFNVIQTRRVSFDLPQNKAVNASDLTKGDFIASDRKAKQQNN
ncbi:hypothetical protein [Vibrio sonorensis]|nr:hypothetical protein [Vibrio sonorensis]